MPIQWDESYSVGNSELDNQHKMLIGQINEIFEAARQGQAAAKVASLIGFLDQYARKHFRYEEAHLKAMRYPMATVHCAMHASFIQTIELAKKRIAKEGATSLLAIELIDFVSKWLSEHIKTTDKRYCEFFATGKCA